jgi:hypothetical protein
MEAATVATETPNVKGEQRRHGRFEIVSERGCQFSRGGGTASACGQQQAIALKNFFTSQRYIEAGRLFCNPRDAGIRL